MVTAVVGINWGDEGKGRMVDLLSAQYDIVSRYQGGNNAGHTVVNDRGTFFLHLIPSGILRPEAVNVMGPAWSSTWSSFPRKWISFAPRVFRSGLRT